MGTGIMKIDDFEFDAFWVPIDQELPPFAIWNDRMIIHQKKEQDEKNVESRTSTLFQSKTQEIEATVKYTKNTENNGYSFHTFSNPKRFANSLSQKQIDPLFFAPKENYIAMRGGNSIDLSDEDLGYFLIENYILGSFQPYVESWNISDKPFILQCGLRKSFKKGCHKAGKIWKKHKTEIIIGLVVVVAVVTAAILLGGIDPTTLVVAGGALLDQLKDDPNSLEPNQPMVQNSSPKQIDQTKSIEPNFDVSKSHFPVRPLDSPSFSESWNAKPAEPFFPTVPGQFQLDRRPSKPPFFVEQKTKDANPFLSSSKENKTSDNPYLSDFSPFQTNFNKSASPSTSSKYPQGLDLSHLNSFPKPSVNPQIKNESAQGINTNLHPTNISSGFDPKEPCVDDIKKKAPEVIWEYFRKVSKTAGSLSEEEKKAFETKFSNSITEPSPQGSNFGEDLKRLEQRHLAWRKAVAEALVNADPSATDLSYGNFAAKAFKGEAFNDFTSPPPFGVLPLIGLPFQDTIHILGGIANDNVTTFESGYCLYENFEKEFAIQAHRLHSNNIAHGSFREDYRNRTKSNNLKLDSFSSRDG